MGQRTALTALLASTSTCREAIISVIALTASLGSSGSVVLASKARMARTKRRTVCSVRLGNIPLSLVALPSTTALTASLASTSMSPAVMNRRTASTASLASMSKSQAVMSQMTARIARRVVTSLTRPRQSVLYAQLASTRMPPVSLSATIAWWAKAVHHLACLSVSHAATANIKMLWVSRTARTSTSANRRTFRLLPQDREQTHADSSETWTLSALTPWLPLRGTTALALTDACGRHSTPILTLV